MKDGIYFNKTAGLKEIHDFFYFSREFGKHRGETASPKLTPLQNVEAREEGVAEVWQSVKQCGAEWKSMKECGRVRME